MMEAGGPASPDHREGQLGSTVIDREGRWRRVTELAARQHGAIAVQQAVRLGVPATTMRDRARREGFARPHPGVVVLPYAADGHSTGFAAALGSGAEAVLTGLPALAVHGLLDPVGLRPDLVMPAGSGRRGGSGMRRRRARTLQPSDSRFVGEVAVATPARALLDVAPRVSPARLHRLLVDARQRRLVDPADLLHRLEDHPSWPGRPRLVHACRTVLASGADSPLVVEVERVLHVAGLTFDVPPRTVRTPTRTLHPDVTLTGVPVAIEADGFGYHADRRALDLDQRKHNAYLLAGWTVLRVTWDRLRDDPAGFVEEVRAAASRSGLVARP